MAGRSLSLVRSAAGALEHACSAERRRRCLWRAVGEPPDRVVDVRTQPPLAFSLDFEGDRIQRSDSAPERLDGELVAVRRSCRRAHLGPPLARVVHKAAHTVAALDAEFRCIVGLSSTNSVEDRSYPF